MTKVFFKKPLGFITAGGNEEIVSLVAVLSLWLRTEIGFEKWEILSLVLLFTSAHPATVEIGRLNLLAD